MSPPHALPTWSIKIPAWNALDLLRLTLRSAVEAAPESAIIEVVDDASTADISPVIDEFDGRVTHYRQPRNVGPIPNFNTCIERSDGEVVHILHADDLVDRAFYERASAVFKNDPSIDAFVCRSRRIDEQGNVMTTTRSERTGSGVWNDAYRVLAISNRVTAPSIAVRRTMLTKLGGFDETFPHAADWHLWFRIARHGTIWFEDEALVDYRVHAAQDTSARIATGTNIVERRRCIEEFGNHLPDHERGRLRRQAMAYSAVFAGRTAARQARKRQWRGASAQAKEAARSLLAVVR